VEGGLKGAEGGSGRAATARQAQVWATCMSAGFNMGWPLTHSTIAYTCHRAPPILRIRHVFVCLSCA
jgi:hypothetical protein